ncbi:hypothetical protein GCM10023350_20910 [Nocardioides endophyticus]|uniref:Uncharacterized protein n=1 Tax=Nocardioides endophyticus TaxID=1353775 RepID=A0ABP8YTZ6_9ACTN
MTEQTVPLASEPPLPPPPVEPPAPKVRRTLGLPVVAAIAVATLLIGGLAGGIIGYAVHSDGPDNDFRDGGPGQRFQHGGPGNGNGMPQPPAGQQGQQQDDDTDS